MANLDLLFQISIMNSGEFKTFKKALAILKRAGMNHDDAVSNLLYAHQNKKVNDYNFKEAKKASSY